jgi:DNA processing protein
VTRTLRRGDPEWPKLLDETGPHQAPTKLWAEGALLEASTPAIAVVGTRRPTGAGMEAAYRLARGVAEAGWIVVSGLAVGIDAMAHRGALDARGRTVAVLGCGLDVDYPSRNRKLRARIVAEGTVVTEYPAGTPPARHHFPLRNRIIAGLSLGVVVVEGAVTSGALVTARLALDMNRSVYALPGSSRNPMAEGPNGLIRTGQAALVTDVTHVFEDLAPSLAFSPTPPSERGRAERRDDDELTVLAALDDVPLPIDRLAGTAGLPPGRAAVLLCGLEVRGLTHKSAAGYAITAAGARALS